jgi:small basic protein
MNFAAFIGILLGLGPYIATTGPWGLTLFATYSTMVEGAVLVLLERHSAKKVFICALAANIVTGVVLLSETIYLHYNPISHQTQSASPSPANQ